MFMKTIATIKKLQKIYSNDLKRLEIQKLR